jgi:hypothetical protein
MFERTCLHLPLSLCMLLMACTETAEESPAPGPDFVITGSVATTPDPQDADAELIRLTGNLDGFAGLYLESGKVIVRRTNISAERAAPATTRAAINAIGSGDSVEIRERPARFDFPQLYGWKRSLTAASAEMPSGFVDLDEVNNVIVVGIEPGADRSSVDRVISRLRIPTEAIEVVYESLPTITQNLRQLVRPLRGAAGTDYDRFNMFEGNCTIGLTVAVQLDYWYKAFLTNSHCSSTMAGIPSPSDTSTYTNAEDTQNVFIVGREYYDITPFQNGACPIFKACRWADVALVRIYDTVSTVRGSIARTTFASPPGVAQPGSIVIDPTAPFQVVGLLKPIPMSASVNKIGRTTGWTQGLVNRTCVNTSAAGHSVYLLCQYRANGYVDDGDSGAPVFQVVSGNSVRMVGLAWGKEQTNFWFSPWFNVLSEGAPKTATLAWTF